MGIVERIVEQNLGVYRASPTRLQEDVSQEAQVASDYRGRLAYELLQNADDAMDGAATPQDYVKFLVTDDALWMANTGRPLSDADVQGLCGLGASSKVDAGGVKRASIGHKGLGFKSVLEITSRPAAMSKSISFELSADIAMTHVAELWEELGKAPPRSVPVMRFPALVDKTHPEWIEFLEQGFSTGFCFPFKSDMSLENRNRLADLLLDLPLTSVLFLKHLEKVEVEVATQERSEDRSWIVQRSARVDSVWESSPGLLGSGLYRVSVKASTGEEAEFILAHDSDVQIGKHRAGLSGPAWDGVTVSEVSVAVLDPDGALDEIPDEWKHFHVFLPTAEPSPYPMLVNGAFTTDLSRQAVRISSDEADYNAHLIRQAASLFAHELLPEIAVNGLENVLNVLDRDAERGEGEAAARLHAAITAEVGLIPLIPSESRDLLSFQEACFPPSLLDSQGREYRSALKSVAEWNGRAFPAADYCTGRWSRVAADHGATELEPAESLSALATLLDPERTTAVDHESGGFEIDPVLEICSAIYEGVSWEEREELQRTARVEALFPVQREQSGSLIRSPVNEGTAFYPPRSAKSDLPLSGLSFMAHSLCWGALEQKERAQALGDRMSAWEGLFGVQEFRFEEVMRAAVLPGLALNLDESALRVREGLESKKTLAAICQLAGRFPKPDRPLRYQRLGNDRGLFNLSRLPVPCRGDDGSVDWVPAYRAYFGADWIGEVSVEGIVDSLRERNPHPSFTPFFLIEPEALDGLLEDLAEDSSETEAEADDDEDEVGLEEDFDSPLESDERTAWFKFFSWIGVNSALRPIHFHDVEDRQAGWLTTKGFRQPQGWAFERLGTTWDEYRASVLDADVRFKDSEVVPYVYELHDLEGLVEILSGAEKDPKGTVGQSLVEHLIRNWDYLEQFTEAQVALVKKGLYPGSRSKPQRAKTEELFTAGDNLWVHRLKTRDYFPTSHGPRRPSAAWLGSGEVERRFGRRGQDAGEILPLFEMAPDLPQRRTLEVAEALGVRTSLSPSTFTIDDARLLCRRIESLVPADGPPPEMLRTVIRPAYRELFELLSGRSSEAENRGQLRAEPLLAEVDGEYAFATAESVFYTRSPGFRQRSGLDGRLPTFVIEADSGATAPLTNLFAIRVLEESLVWTPNPGETSLTDQELEEFRGGLKSLLPDLLARVRAERSERSDRRILEEFLEHVEPVGSLELGCSIDGRQINVRAEREYYVKASSGSAPLQAFVVWDGPAWPPHPDEAQRLAMALADSLEINLVETFLAFVQSDSDQRKRLLDIAGASRYLEDAQRDLAEPLQAGPPEPSPETAGIAPTTSPLAGTSTEAQSDFTGENQPAVPRVKMVDFEDLWILGEPIVVAGESGGRDDATSTESVAGAGGKDGHGVHRAPPGTDLVSLDALGMRIAMTYEVFRLRRLDFEDPTILESGHSATSSENLVVDVSTPAAIRQTEKASRIVRNVLASLEREGINLIHPGFDILTISDAEADRLIELKSSGVDARVHSMTWNEWKSARNSALRSRFWLYLVGNLRADIPGIPYLRAINDPFESLYAEEVSEQRISRAVQLRVREFTHADHLDLVQPGDLQKDLGE